MQPKTYLVLLEPIERPPPPDADSSLIEKLRNRDDDETLYVGKIARECSVSVFDVRNATDSVGQVWIELSDTNAGVLQCVKERAITEQIDFDFRNEIVPFSGTIG